MSKEPRLILNKAAGTSVSRFLRFGILVIAVSCATLSSTLAEETATNSAAATTTETNNQEILRAYLQLQEQLHLTQLAIEQNRKEARETAAQNSESLGGRLQALEQAMERQRTQELETMQSSNRVLLTVAGTFASVGFLAMLLMSFFQWRTVSKLAQLPSPDLRKELPPGESPVVSVGTAEQSSLRLLGAVEQLEKRLHHLEHTTRTPLTEGSLSNGVKGSAGEFTKSDGEQHQSTVTYTVNAEHSSEDSSDRAAVLLGKGQSMLNLDDAQSALTCFDEALKLDANNAEAWIRKGTALERLQQLDQAVECYDRAIAADKSLTIAYLHKGGLFNRMERFNEALECYEKALRTQEKRGA